MVYVCERSKKCHQNVHQSHANSLPSRVFTANTHTIPGKSTMTVQSDRVA